MKKIQTLLAMTILCVGIFAGCNQEQVADAPQATVKPTSKVTAEITPEPTSAPLVATKVILDYTDAFSIMDYGNDIKLVTDADGQKFFLVPSVNEELPEIPQEAADALIIRTPITKAVFGSSTQLGQLRAVAKSNEFNSIIGTFNAPNSINIDEVESKLLDGTTTYVGGDWGDPDYELLTTLEPDMIFLYTGDWGQGGIKAKLDELEIPNAINNDYMENDYMARVEWVKFMATFYNLDEEASLFVQSQKELVMEVELDTAELEKPKVVWANIYDGVIYIASSTSYVGDQMRSAGCDYVFTEAEDDIAAGISIEKFYSVAKDADIFIYSSTTTYMSDPTIQGIVDLMPIIEDMKSITEGKVYSFSDDYFTSVDKAAVAIKDLAAICYPQLYSDWEISMFKSLS